MRSSSRHRTPRDRDPGRRVAFVLLAVGLGGCSLATPSASTDAEAEIWALERRYWEDNRDAKYEEIIATWHEDFLGWPESEPAAIDKDEGARYVRRAFTAPASYEFEIDRGGVVFCGDVAVNHYRIHLTTTDEKGIAERSSLRITHTWVREDGGWKVLGGMSAK